MLRIVWNTQLNRVITKYSKPQPSGALLLFNKIMITTCLSHWCLSCSSTGSIFPRKQSPNPALKSPGWKLQWFKHQQTTSWRHLCCRDRVTDWGKWVSAEIQAAVHPTCQSASSNYSYQWSHLPVTKTENLASIVQFMDSGISTKCVYMYTYTYIYMYVYTHTLRHPHVK